VGDAVVEGDPRGDQQPIGALMAHWCLPSAVAGMRAAALRRACTGNRAQTATGPRANTRAETAAAADALTRLLALAGTWAATPGRTGEPRTAVEDHHRVSSNVNTLTPISYAQLTPN
jgi:hypothetical protein